jgi:dihydrofolate synthase/folylpolyglutamate synthase
VNYTETIDFLYSKLPMFTRIGVAAYKKDLTNTIAFCNRLDHPEKKFKSVHIAGTNGKGSTSHMLAAVLQQAGYKTGLYTSPHLKDFRERIKINGEMISEAEIVDFVKAHQDFILALSPSFFEVTVAMAFEYFAQQNVDIAIIEVGLGGRLDSTNIISPELSIITNIGWDHMNLLGNTLPLIAAEKAGIIKPNIPVIIGEYQEEIISVFENKAKECNASFLLAENEWSVTDNQLSNHQRKLKINSAKNSYDLSLDLTGSYQIKNVKAVLSAVQILNKLGFEIKEADVVSALADVKKLTGLMGRWQTLENNPLIICDTGHNLDGIKVVLENINQINYEKLHLIIGMVKDKDISKMLSLFPKNATYYFCSPNIERAKQATELQLEARNFGLIGDAYESVEQALLAAKKNANKKDFIFIGGSTFVVAEVV